MAPTTDIENQVNELPRSILAGAKLAHPEPGEEVVISGLSGRFPDSDDVYEFRDKLFDKVDLVSGDGRRWKLGWYPISFSKISRLIMNESFRSS